MDNKPTELDINKIRKIAMDSMYLLIVLAVSIFYIFYGLLKMDETGKSLEQIIADGFLTLIVGYSIGLLLSAQGYKNGWNDEGLLQAQKEHREKVAQINSKLDDLDIYLEERHQKKVQEYRMQLLSEEALSYNDFIEGKYAKYQTDKELRKNLAPSQLKAIHKAYHCKLKKLKATDLIKGDGEYKVSDEDDLGETLSEHKTKTSVKALGSKILFAIFFGYFGIKMAEDFNWMNLIWTGLQVTMFLASGFIKYDSAYTYMKENVKDRYHSQVDLLTSFEAWDNKRIKEGQND